MYRVRRLLTLFQLLQVPLLILLLATPFWKVLYYFDADNHYCRSFGYRIWFYDTFAAFLVIGAVVICCYRRTDRFMKNVFVIGAAVPVTAFFLDFFIHSVSLNSISVMLAGLLIFFLYENHKVTYAIESSRQMDRMQMKLMLSQIQPHFLHNTLTSILYYADKDQEKTKKALVDFSMYLRKNMDSIDTELPVRFLEELEHTKKYLSLEKLRFEDDIHVEYDIKEDRFHLPVLTLQPLVENAVRHGIRKRKGSRGTVIIRTGTTGTYNIVEVEDDGVGFDVAELEVMDGTHIGIRNVRGRLATECHGQLEIESVPGEGTVCRILIPKDRRPERE